MNRANKSEIGDVVLAVIAFVLWVVLASFISYNMGKDAASPSKEQCYEITSSYEDYHKCVSWGSDIGIE